MWFVCLRLFIYLAASGLSCGTRDLLFSSWHVGSLAAACKLLAAAHEIWFPDPGSTQGSLHWELGALVTEPLEKSQNLVLNLLILLCVLLVRSFVHRIPLSFLVIKYA